MTGQVGFVSVRDRITSASDKKHQFPVNYAFDYLHGGIKYLHRPQLKLNDHIQANTFLKLAAAKTLGGGQATERSRHGIDLFPLKAGLPWPSGMLSCRQSKHWQLSLDVIEAWLKEFATSNLAGIGSESGKSIRELAQKELSSTFADGWARFAIYIWPDAEEERMRHLSAVTVLIFLLDDFWEMHDVSAFQGVEETLIECMRPDRKRKVGHESSPALIMIERTIAEILELDERNGNNAGRDMIERMIRFFTRPAPPPRFNSMDEFLLHRHEDAAVPFVLACTKFSLNSSVDLDSSRLARYLRLVGNHIAVANDLSSWEKEKKAYDCGEVLYMINIVDIVKQLFSLSTFEAAVAVAEVLQLQMECEIDEEIERLVREDALTADEWRFVDATLHTMTGNVLVSIITSRYGGAGCRLG
ncbi:hypothetical protein XA68_14701 [Ophiocordyceps unilateralis]|uniref:Terpene synthase n=1 Tax=Ophiocordyceps unilateralis TaxID=268505 RepID=A0A2A9P9V5_OPHUN|nr:hypothetical protein XA68_14701 [Ophiocordyceps unilateralis]